MAGYEIKERGACSPSSLLKVLPQRSLRMLTWEFSSEVLLPGVE